MGGAEVSKEQVEAEAWSLVIDTSAITIESMPVEYASGDALLPGPSMPTARSHRNRHRRRTQLAS